MSSQWPIVKLGKVLRHRSEFITIDDFGIYKRPRVQLHAQGIVLRDEVPGAFIKTKTQQVCHEGEFLVAEIDAKVGGFGIVTEALNGAIVSSHYFLFQIDETRLERHWLDYIIQTPMFRDQVQAQGSTNYAAIRPAQVLSYEIPLPPLAEQRRVVARIEELVTQIHEAHTLRYQAAEESDALIHSVMSRVIAEAGRQPSWEVGPIPLFAEINPSRVGNVNLGPTDPVSFVPMKAVDDVTGTIAWPEKRLYAEVGKGYTWFKDGDEIFARITPCMQNGKAALARNLLNGVGFGSTEFHVIRPGPKLIGEWLHALVRHKAFRDDAAAHFRGTAGQQRVPETFLREKVIPVPPLSEQRAIVAQLDALQAEVDALKRLQGESAAELDALLPAILDRAFKGEL
jgi:type I restriction enzyme S subunit